MSAKEIPGIFTPFTFDKITSTASPSLRVDRKLQRGVLERAVLDYPHIADANIFAIIPPSTGKTILDSIDNLALNENGENLLKLAETIFNSIDSFELVMTNFLRRPNNLISDSSPISYEDELHDNIKEVARNKGITTLLPYIHDQITHKEESRQKNTKILQAKNRLALALLLSRLTVGEIPNLLADKLGSFSWLDYKVKPTHGQWNLCKDAEIKMDKGISAGQGLVLIDNVILAKNNGYVTGLCLKPIATTQGILIPGMWYSPTSKDFRDQVRNAIAIGRTNLSTHSNTEWAVMRSVILDKDPNQSPAQFIKRATAYGEHLLNTPK